MIIEVDQDPRPEHANRSASTSSDDKIRPPAAIGAAISNSNSAGASQSETVDTRSQPSSSVYSDATSSSPQSLYPQSTGATSIDTAPHTPIIETKPSQAAAATLTPTMAITHPSELGRAAFGSSVPSSSSSAPSGSNTQTQTLLNPNAPSSSSSPSSPAFPQPVIPEIVVDSADPPPPSYAETFPNGAPARPGPSPAPASTTSSRGSRRSGRSGRGRGNQSPIPNAPQNNQYPPQAVYVPPAARAAGAAAGMNERCSRGFHDYETHFGVIGIVMAILLFPFGIFCLFIDRKRKCRKCGFIWEN